MTTTHPLLSIHLGLFPTLVRNSTPRKRLRRHRSRPSSRSLRISPRRGRLRLRGKGEMANKARGTCDYEMRRDVRRAIFQISAAAAAAPQECPSDISQTSTATPPPVRRRRTTSAAFAADAEEATGELPQPAPTTAAARRAETGPASGYLT